MSVLCSCDSALKNTGSPTCKKVFGVGVNYLMVPIYANDGTANCIDATTTLNAAYFTALFNQSDDSKRFYPTGKLTNVTGERADSIKETFDNGTSVYIRQGIRNFASMLVQGSFELAAQFNANRCSTFGIFIVDVDGSVLGKKIGNDGKLYPVEIDAATFEAKMVFTTDTTIQKIMLMGQWGVLEKDDDLRMISANSITGINLANATGLMDVYCKIISTSTTTMVLDIYAKFDDIVTNYPIEGLVAADFVSSNSGATSKIYDITDLTDLTVTVVESSTIKGRYTLSYTGAVTNELLQPLIKKNGLDGYTMRGTVGTVV